MLKRFYTPLVLLSALCGLSGSAHGQAAAKAPEVDADVAIAGGNIGEDPQQERGSVDIVIDWNKPTVVSTNRQFSINIFSGEDPEVANDERYQKNLAYMAPGFLRYHRMSGLTSGRMDHPQNWIDESMRFWLKDKIARSLDGFSHPADQVMITIGKWPPRMDADGDGMLDKDQYEAFAQLCADLVHLLNVEQKRGIKYFEITNERDIVYWRGQVRRREPTHVDELAKIYNLCAEAMKKVDPTIMTGGPAACSPDMPRQLRRFMELTKDNLDFFSYHMYASGNPKESDASIYDKTERLGLSVERMRNLAHEVTGRDDIEIHLNEWNICYTGRVKDPRMTNNKGAVFDALCFIQFANNGLDVGNAWNEMCSVYGKMSRRFELRPAAHIFHYFNTWLVGQAVEATSSDTKRVVPFAVEQDGRRSFVLVNRSNAENLARITFVGAAGQGGFEMVQIAESGMEQTQAEDQGTHWEVLLSPHSVTFYSR